jgi:hypothetical protein
MLKPVAIVGQVILYGAFAAFIGTFATAPKYRQIADDTALIKLSISHLGGRECRQRSPEELAKMPPNMRAPMDCPRERSDIKLEVDLDGEPVFRTVMRPTGLYKDGVSTVYKRFEVKSGSHQLTVKMDDNLDKAGFAYVRSERITLVPAQVMVIDFNPDQGGLFFK